MTLALMLQRLSLVLRLARSFITRCQWRAQTRAVALAIMMRCEEHGGVSRCEDSDGASLQRRLPPHICRQGE